MTTMEELLCRGWPYGARFTVAVFWCQSSLPCRCVICVGGWVVLWYRLKLATGYVGSEAPWERLWSCQGHLGLCPAQDHLVWAKKWSADGCCLCWAWRCLGEAKLQSKTGSHWCQAWGLLARGAGYAEARCFWGLRTFERSQESRQHEPRQATYMEKPQKCLSGPESQWGRVTGNQ